MNATILLLITLNLVMTEENGKRVNLPAQVIYYDNESTLQLNVRDSIEIYHIDQRSTFKGSIVFRLSSIDCVGYMEINTSTTPDGKLKGSVWFYKYCNHQMIERRFSVDTTTSYYLAKQIQKKRKRKKNILMD